MHLEVASVHTLGTLHLSAYVCVSIYVHMILVANLPINFSVFISGQKQSIYRPSHTQDLPMKHIQELTKASQGYVGSKVGGWGFGNDLSTVLTPQCYQGLFSCAWKEKMSQTRLT